MISLQSNASTAERVGSYIMRKYRERAKEAGVQAVAKQLRKQGYSLEMAREILLGEDDPRRAAHVAFWRAAGAI